MVYGFSRTLTIDKTKVPNTNQVNFPVLFSGTYAYLATVANGGKVTSSSGFDIIFTSDAAGLTKLDHEIESYNPVTGAVNFWVRVPTVTTATDTIIYLWYGNAAITTSQENVTGVWDVNFNGVWHLKEAAGGSGTIKDSTSNAKHLTDTGGPTFGATGQIDKAISFDGSNDYLSIAASIVPTGNAVKTVSGWFKSVTTISTRQFLFYAGTETTRGRFAMEIESSKLNLNYQSAALAGATTLVSGQWYHGVIVSDGSLIKVYLNDAQDASGSPSGGTLNTGTTVETFLAAFKTPSLFLNGLMDEVRVSNVVRSADWIATEYNNQFSPSTFYAVGAEVATAVIVLSATGWLKTKGNGPWPFVPQPDKFGYVNNPRWTKAAASLVDHEPCGYWWKCR